MAKYWRAAGMLKVGVMLSMGLLILNSAAAPAQTVPGFELVVNVPEETKLQEEDLREASEVWTEMFDGAQHSIDIAQFYVANKAGSRLDDVISHLRAAAERGVKIRFLMEKKGEGISLPGILDLIRSIPNLEFREIDFQKLTGGILHAKYLLVDGKQAFIGSQNFDWRALEHVHETGLLITDAPVVQQVQAIFEGDWQLAEKGAAAGVETAPRADASEGPHAGNYLVASPRAFNPPGVIDSQQELPALLRSAEKRIRVQVMDYAPLSFGPDHSRPFYSVLDNELRAAAARGVKVQLMVSNWNTKKPEIYWLKSLALVPGIELRIVTIPAAKVGFIPFARVIHSKIMTIDDHVAWVRE